MSQNSEISSTSSWFIDKKKQLKTLLFDKCKSFKLLDILLNSHNHLKSMNREIRYAMKMKFPMDDSAFFVWHFLSSVQLNHSTEPILEADEKKFAMHDVSSSKEFRIGKNGFTWQIFGHYGFIFQDEDESRNYFVLMRGTLNCKMSRLNSVIGLFPLGRIS